MGSTGVTSLRKGLNNWDAAKDAAMGSGLETSLAIPDADALNDTEQSGTTEFLAKRMRYNPRREEREILDKLSDQNEKLMSQSYGKIDKAVASFFDKLDAAGDISNLEAVELERMILDIQRVIYLATDVVSSLYNDAYFADRIQQDEFWQAYRADDIDGLAKPTQGDRNAYAYSMSRDARFYYYYNFLLWKRLSDKMGSLRDLQKTLEFFRSRSLKDRPF